MTTNLTLDEMREIVSKAPEKTQVVIPCSDGYMFFTQRPDGRWFRFSDSYEKWLEYYGKADPMDLAITLSSMIESIQALESAELMDKTLDMKIKQRRDEVKFLFTFSSVVLIILILANGLMR